jgi:hypothetical protein
MKFDCSYSELLDINSPKIIPNPKNPNKHPEEQIERLSKIIEYQGQRHPLIISKRSGFLVVGHGRLEAIKKLGWEQIAVSYQDFDSEAQEYSFVVSDNAIASWSELDLGEVSSEMLDLGPDFDIDLFGIENFVIDLNEEENETYTRKVESPIYTPSGENPNIDTLFDTEVTDKLIAEIDEMVESTEIKIFLKFAAHRHTKFNYKNIAEYYAHASPIVKKLMEDSALVVIDFDKAIELGFVKLSNDLKESLSAEDE